MRYHRIFVLSVLAAVPLGDHANPHSPHWDDMHPKHSWDAVPENWESLGCPPAGTTIDLYIALKPYREIALIDALYEVSEPRHPKHVLLATPPLVPLLTCAAVRFRYGAHLTKEQVAELVAPRPDTLELVSSWLNHHGLPSSSAPMTHGGSTLTLTGVSVAQANRLLNASYELYRHFKTNETIVRTVGYGLPAVLHEHVQTVAPTTHFASPRMRRQTPRKRSGGATAEFANATLGEPVTVLSSRADDITSPSFLHLLYNTFSYTPTAVNKNMLGIVGLKKDYPNPADLAAFMRKYRSDGADATYAVVRVNYGEYDPSHPTVEANLDVQYSEGMAYPTPHVFYSTGSGASGKEDWHLSWLEYLVKQPSIPQTISVSYGYYERDLPPEYATRVCDLIAQLGARGVSVLFSAGDHGVGEGNCVTKDGSVRFKPEFPATCMCGFFSRLRSST